MAYSTPRTWVAGEYPTAVQMNANVRDNVSFLANLPVVRARRTTTQSINDNSSTAVVFDATNYDTNSMYSATSHITFTTAGVYVVTFNGEFVAGNDYVYIRVDCRLNGATSLGVCPSDRNNTAVYAEGVAGSWQYKFAAADYVEFLVHQDNSANTARNLAAGAWGAAAWQGLG